MINGGCQTTDEYGHVWLEPLINTDEHRQAQIRVLISSFTVISLLSLRGAHSLCSVQAPRRGNLLVLSTVEWACLPFRRFRAFRVFRSHCRFAFPIRCFRRRASAARRTSSTDCRPCAETSFFKLRLDSSGLFPFLHHHEILKLKKLPLHGRQGDHHAAGLHQPPQLHSGGRQ